MSSSEEYYGVEKRGNKWIAKYDYEQKLDGKDFDSEEEARAFVEADDAMTNHTPQDNAHSSGSTPEYPDKSDDELHIPYAVSIRSKIMHLLEYGETSKELLENIEALVQAHTKQREQALLDRLESKKQTVTITSGAMERIVLDVITALDLQAERQQLKGDSDE